MALVADIGTVTFSSQATVTSALPLTEDADVIGIYMTGTSTSSIFVEVAPSSSGTAFSTAYNASGAPISISSGGGMRQILGASFRQIRVSSTGAVAQATSIIFTKQISV